MLFWMTAIMLTGTQILSADATGSDDKNLLLQCQKNIAALKASYSNQVCVPKNETIKPGAGGYKKALWGMTPQQVHKAYPKASDHDGSLIISGKTAGYDSTTVFFFTAKSLTAVGVMLTKQSMNANTYVNDYHQLQTLLTKKYGKPVGDSRHWSQDLYKNDPKHIGMAVSMGHLTLVSNWTRPKTKIELVCRGENFKVKVYIRYVSVALEGLKTQTDENEKLDDL